MLELEKARNGCLRRCTASLSSDRKRLQSECSSGVSTRFSCSESNHSNSSCSIASGLSTDSGEDEDEVSNFETSGLSSLTHSDGEKTLKKKENAFTDLVTFSSATNEGLVVCRPPPLTQRLVVNPVPSVEIVWNYGVVDGTLVAHAPVCIQKACGINDALVTLLEYGENELHCSRAVILVGRDSPEKDSLLRMFSFLGFLKMEEKAMPPSLRSYLEQYVLLVTDFADLQDNDSDEDGLE